MAHCPHPKDDIANPHKYDLLGFWPADGLGWCEGCGGPVCTTCGTIGTAQDYHYDTRYEAACHHVTHFTAYDIEAVIDRDGHSERVGPGDVPEEDEGLVFYSVYGRDVDGLAYCIGDFTEHGSAVEIARAIADGKPVHDTTYVPYQKEVTK